MVKTISTQVANKQLGQLKALLQKQHAYPEMIPQRYISKLSQLKKLANKQEAKLGKIGFKELSPLAQKEILGNQY